MTSSLTAAQLAEAFRSTWSEPHRLKTLGRIVVHERQFENWWKFELASHPWELAEELGIYVWLEADGRADIVLAHARDDQEMAIDLSRAPRVPIELMTVGTFLDQRCEGIRGGRQEALATGHEDRSFP